MVLVLLTANEFRPQVYYSTPMTMILGAVSVAMQPEHAIMVEAFPQSYTVQTESYTHSAL